MEASDKVTTAKQELGVSLLAEYSLPVLPSGPNLLLTKVPELSASGALFDWRQYWHASALPGGYAGYSC